MFFKKHKRRPQLDNENTITINYPTSAANRPRWGYDTPPHPILSEILGRNRDRYARLLKSFFHYRDTYLKINIEEDAAHPEEPFLGTIWLPGLDSLALYSFMAIHSPKRYIEVGSGNSTKFARRAVRDHDLRTILISIDPQPRAEIDSLCDQVIREPVELVDITLFDCLEENDILFIDNSHRCFMNSDVTSLFLDVIPRLRPGVLVQIHDIFLPYDYPPHWIDRYYSEQYLLAAYLLAEGSKFEILLPNAYISRDPTLHGLIKPLFADLKDVSTGGGSFWFTLN